MSDMPFKYETQDEYLGTDASHKYGKGADVAKLLAEPHRRQQDINVVIYNILADICGNSAVYSGNLKEHMVLLKKLVEEGLF